MYPYLTDWPENNYEEVDRYRFLGNYSPKDLLK